MRSVMDGMRAGVIAALVLTLWSLLAAGEIVGDAGASTGMKFVAATFGLLGVAQIAMGIVLGAVVALWAVVLDRLELLPVRDAVADPGTDRRMAAGLLTAPVFLAAVGAGVMALHLAVTSGFSRAGFQALGLALGAAGLTALVGLVTPAIYGSFAGAMHRLPLGGDGSMWTWLVVGLYGLGAILAVGIGYSYAVDLRVWSQTEIQMAIAFLLLVPVVFALMHRWQWQRGAWRFGIPLAGLVVAAGCFYGASSWATSTAELRALMLRDAPLVSSMGRAVIEVGGDEEIFSQSGCEGEGCEEDEQPPEVTDPDHPARRIVSQAARTANRAQINEFEAIPDPPKNVVVLVIDTLRQDHMGYAGYHRDTTPNLDAVAEDAVVFNHAYATSPHTPRTIPPLFFGRYASNIQWILPDTNFPRVREEALSMYEVLQDRGWQNISKTSHFYFRERRGVNQGFDVWDNEGKKSLEDSHDDIATPRIWDKIEPTLEELGREHREQGDEAQPFTLFVHFFDPHARYNHHDEFSFDRGDTRHERLIADYDSEIAHADHYAGKLIDKLKKEELYDDVIFVFTSDHGEAFNEHGRYFHGHDLYNTVINVPKLVRVPGWFSREVDGPVSIIDIAPTLLDLLGVSVPAEFEGEVLTDVLLGRSEVPDRPVFAELLPYTALDEHHRAVIDGDMKLIVDFKLDLAELYDLSEDPMEQNNLIDERPEEAARLRQMLDEFMQ